MKVLICDPDFEWAKVVSSAAEAKSIKTSICTNGRDVQLKVYKEAYDAIILDLETRHNSAIEVLKYLKLNCSQMKIVLTAGSEQQMRDLGLEKETTKKLGVAEVFFKPCRTDQLLRVIEGDTHFTDWKAAPASTVQAAEENVTAKDEEFTRVKLVDFCSGNHAIFDHYIRLSPGKYVKILHKHEKLDQGRLAHYRESQSVEYLYFKTKDRGSYVNFINEVISKALENGAPATPAVLGLSRSVAEKFIDEVYTAGLKPQLVEEGVKICQNMYDLVSRDKNLAQTLKEYLEYDPPAQTHLFLTAFFSTLICKNLDWSTSRTAETITLAAFLHDIGKIKLPGEIISTPKDRLTKEQRAVFEQHPLFGYNLLEKYPTISSAVRQVVYQHHEQVDGSGYPNGTSGNKIFPMAKIVSLADFYSNLLIENRLPPLEGLKLMLKIPDFTHKFDPHALKSLITGFIKDRGR